MPELHPFISGLWDIHLPAQREYWFDNGQSFGYFPSNNVKSIFLGSFPVYDVVHYNNLYDNKAFFYGVTGNRMWPILSKISSYQLKKEDDIFKLLQKAKFGITDVLRKVNRESQKAVDDALTPLLFNDIIDLWQHFPNLTNIYVTSGGSGAVNSNHIHVAGRLKKYFDSMQHQYIGFNIKSYKKTIKIYKDSKLLRAFNLISLLSPSMGANPAIQGIINANPAIQQLVNNLPSQVIMPTKVDNARILQWSYFLQNSDFIINNELNNFLNQHSEELMQVFG